MPVVFVHGNPETAAIWDELRTNLDRQDVIALSPPGFGAAVPDGFGATADEYYAWLAAELEKLDGPIDLVGHDWGAGHVARIAMGRPDLIRSWVIDIAGAFDPEYVWHDFAQAWQKPGVGEQAIAATIAAGPVARAAQFESMGMTKAVAASLAEANNEAMGRCILALYRSAAQPAMAKWGADLERAAARPGLVIVATEDHFTGGPVLAARQARRAGAKLAILEGLGHWWMCQDPKRGAAVLNEFLAGVG